MFSFQRTRCLHDREYDLVLAAHHGQHRRRGLLAARAPGEWVADERVVEDPAVHLEEARHLLRHHTRKHVEPHRRLDDELRRLGAPLQCLLGPAEPRVVEHVLHVLRRDPEPHTSQFPRPSEQRKLEAMFGFVIASPSLYGLWMRIVSCIHW